ncbi:MULTISPECIES: glycosyltransferase [Sediminibacterium]|uniref:glycosyltransferase n=1 Tax=Sediminibacterium TaxID=504481 RepID=UPI00047DE356|nr:glycosyltransferase [Sediminibacterium salmoneum]
MRVPKVLGIVSFKVFPAHMGGQQYIVHYYQSLAQYGKVILAVSSDNQVLAADKSDKDDATNAMSVYPILFNHWQGWKNLLRLKDLIQLIRKEEIEWTVIDHSYFGWLGFLLRVFTGKKFLIKSANIEANRFKEMGRKGWRLYQWYEKKVHQLANFSFFISETDRAFAIQHWGLPLHKTGVIPFGTFRKKPVTPEQRDELKRSLLNKHQLADNTILFFFNGTLDYIPNKKAIYDIIQELIPTLNKSSLTYKIIISGVQIERDLLSHISKCPEIIYEGFVQDIQAYYAATDCFICPVSLGAGVKTKLIDALASGLPVIAFEKSAEGISSLPLNKQLTRISNFNWNLFSESMIRFSELKREQETVSAEFYKEYHWDHIVQESILSLPK